MAVTTSMASSPGRGLLSCAACPAESAVAPDLRYLRSPSGTEGDGAFSSSITPRIWKLSAEHPMRYIADELDTAPGDGSAVPGASAI